MEILKVHGARSIWLFDTGLLNPRGVSFFHLVKDLAQEFSFIDYPRDDDFRTGKSIRFDKGVFSAFGEETNVTLELFDDGFVADSRHSTELCDEFLTAVLAWIGSRLGVNHRNIQIRSKMYRSEVVVQTDSSIADVCAEVQKMSEILTLFFEGKPQELTGLHFGSEEKHSSFVFERRADEQFALNHFYSSAAVSTGVHSEALKALGSFFTK